MHFRFHRFIFVACAGVVALSSARLHAEPTKDLGQGVSRAQVTRIALERSPALRAARHRVRALELSSKAAGRLPDPELMMEVWQVPVSRPYAVNRAGMIMFGLKQAIPAPGSLGAREASLSERAHVVKAERDDAARVVVRDVGHAFADYLEVEARHRIHGEHSALAERVAQLARARNAAGGALSEVTQAEVEESRAHADVAGESAKIRAVRARLNSLMARPSDAPLGPPSDSGAESVTLSPEAIVQRALEHRPDLKANRTRLRAERAELHASEKEAVVPSFSVGGLYFAPTEANSEHGYGVSASMSLPWVWGGGRERRAAQRETVASMDADIEQTRLGISADVSASLASVDGAAGRLEVLQKQTLPATRRNVDLALSSYESGAVRLLDVLTAERDVVDVEIEIVMARAALDHALVDLDFAAGEPLPRKRLDLGGSDVTAH